jgi:hypothetical protein
MNAIQTFVNLSLEDTGVGTRVAVVDPRDLMSDSRSSQLADDAAKQLEIAIDCIGV